MPGNSGTQGYQEAPGVGSIRSEIEVGSAKTRRYPKANPTAIKKTQLMTKAQTQALDTFYITTLSNGTLSFSEAHDRTGVITEFRFTTRPTYTYLGGNLYSCAMDLEIVE
jgi:hypothetical protein